MNQMAKAAAPMPTVCTRKEKSLATVEETPSTMVNRGNARELWQVPRRSVLLSVQLYCVIERFIRVILCASV
jgi:hypothetical protein